MMNYPLFLASELGQVNPDQALFSYDSRFHTKKP